MLQYRLPTLTVVVLVVALTAATTQLPVVVDWLIFLAIEVSVTAYAFSTALFGQGGRRAFYFGFAIVAIVMFAISLLYRVHELSVRLVHRWMEIGDFGDKLEFLIHLYLQGMLATLGGAASWWAWHDCQVAAAPHSPAANHLARSPAPPRHPLDRVEQEAPAAPPEH